MQYKIGLTIKYGFDVFINRWQLFALFCQLFTERAGPRFLLRLRWKHSGEECLSTFSLQQTVPVKGFLTGTTVHNKNISVRYLMNFAKKIMGTRQYLYVPGIAAVLSQLLFPSLSRERPGTTFLLSVSGSVGPWGHGRWSLGHDTKSRLVFWWRHFLSGFWHHANSHIPSPSPNASPSPKVTGNVLYSVSGSSRQSAAPTMDSDPSSSSGMALE